MYYTGNEVNKLQNLSFVGFFFYLVFLTVSSLYGFNLIRYAPFCTFHLTVELKKICVKLIST